MNSYYYTFLLIFTVIVAMMIVDNNVGIYINLIFKIIQVNTERFFWMIKFHPNNFVTTWFQNRKYNKLAKELEKEFAEKKL